MSISIGDVIKTYMTLRAQRDEIEAKVKDQLADLKIKMAKLEAYLKDEMDKQNLTSFKSEYGTAFLTTTDYASVADWQEVLAYIRETESFDLLTQSVSKLAVRAFIEENKQVPPGVNYGTKVDVNIRKPTAKAELEVPV